SRFCTPYAHRRRQALIQLRYFYLREAAVGDVLSLRVRELVEQQDGQVRNRADAGVAAGELARARECDHVLQRLDRHFLASSTIGGVEASITGSKLVRGS